MSHTPGRLGLVGAWALAPGQPGVDEAPSDDAAWRAVDGPMPVAAALAAAGEWSIDGPARDFDRECWWYRCRFDLPDAHHEPVAGPTDALTDATLGLDGLATLARVWLNGEWLLDSRSMFRAHALDVRLRARGNELLIRFDPLHDALALRRPRPRWRSPMLAQQQLRFFRTTLLGRTPGWSPPATVVGPWRGVWWQPWAAGARPARIDLQPRLVGQRGELSVRCQYEPATSLSELRVVLDHLGTAHEVPLSRSADGLAWQGTLSVDDVAAWWPHTHGTPQRHAAHLHGRMADGSVWVHAIGVVGFRSVDAEPAEQGFGLRINSEPVFARGVCWVPLDSVKLHAETAQYREVLTRLRDAGVNLIRVGGTMVYESDAFFELCDELGLMVWQELMFANMDYPADDAAFAAEVEAELACQLPAWAARASVVVVCGNSEVEQQAAMWGAAREHWQPDLFHQRIALAVADALPGVVYWPSSAHGGAFPFQPQAGTTSYYGVGAYRRPLDDARASGVRFASECLAFAQVPPDSTLARLRALNDDIAVRTHSPLWKARAPRDLGAGWDFDDVRDHYVQHLFGEDPLALRMSDPARHLVLGRAAASEAVMAAFSQWRSAGSVCRGALVWFLRDLWAGAGWGYLDDTCQPKAVFHALSRVCQPLHLGVTDDGLNGLSLHAVNERGEALPGALSVRAYREGEWLVGEGSRELTLPARSCQGWSTIDWLEGFADLSWAYRFGPPPADVLVLRWQGAGGETAERVHFIDTAGAALRRSDIGLSAESRALPDGRVEVRVSTRAAARFVHFEADGWQAEDEGFHLAPGAEKVLRFNPVPGVKRTWRATVGAINALVPVTVHSAG